MPFDQEIEDALAVVRSMTPRHQKWVARSMRQTIILIEEEETMTCEERDKLLNLRREAARERMRSFRKRWNLDE